MGSTILERFVVPVNWIKFKCWFWE